MSGYSFEENLRQFHIDWGLGRGSSISRPGGKDLHRCEQNFGFLFYKILGESPKQTYSDLELFEYVYISSHDIRNKTCLAVYKCTVILDNKLNDDKCTPTALLLGIDYCPVYLIIFMLY